MNDSKTPQGVGTRTDELVKQDGGLDPVRSEWADRDWRTETPDALKARFREHFLDPNGALVDAAPDIKRRLDTGQVVVVIPMKERTGVIGGTLEVLTKQLPPECIMVVNDRSEAPAIDAVRQFSGVRLLDRNDALSMLDWSRLLPILNLKEIPVGKGMAVLAGYLAMHALETRGEQHFEHIVMCDAEITQFERYQCLEHLAYGLLTQPSAHHVMMAKVGRNNDITMAARTLLGELADSDALPTAIRDRCGVLQDGLEPILWMLTGERVSSQRFAFKHPFATGYLLETLISTASVDFGMLHGTPTFQVSNPNRRIDAPNTRAKEMAILNMVAKFVVRLALAGKPLTEWDTEFIQNFNATRMSRPARFAYIPEPEEEKSEGPVIPEVIMVQDRIVPSVQALDDSGLIIPSALDALVAKLVG